MFFDAYCSCIYEYIIEIVNFSHVLEFQVIVFVLVLIVLIVFDKLSSFYCDHVCYMCC